MESKGFTISCNDCGARGEFGISCSKESLVIGLWFDKETPNIMPTMTVFCNKCGSKQVFAVIFPIDYVDVKEQP